MSELILPAPLLGMAERGRVSADDVLHLRRVVFSDNSISRREAEALFALDKTARDKCAEWDEFFVEAITDHIVRQSDPAGTISEENADWLMSCVSRDGLVDSVARFEMLVKVMEVAESSPERLLRLALEQVARAVLHNQGAAATGRPDVKQVICEADVQLLRRMIFAFGSDGGLAITRCEAEFLFDLNDKTVESENHPSWSQLFVRAIGNHLFATLNGAVPTRTVALQEDEFLSGGSLFDGLVNTLRSLYRAMRPLYKNLDDAIERNTAEMIKNNAEAAQLTKPEASWVIDRINRDGAIHQNEKALVASIKQEVPELGDLLKAVA